VGKYASPNGAIPPDIMKKHIDTAAAGGIDYFLFQVRSASRDNVNYKNDSVLVRNFVDANTNNKMKFAIAYNFSSGTYGIATATPIEADVNKVNQFVADIERFVPYFQTANYMKVGGKILVYIMNAQTIFSNDNPSLYNKVRARLSALGFELYIVGMQDRWTPPARYTFRYQRCVDAIYHQSFVSGNTSWDRFYLLPQAIDQNWEYSRTYFKDSLGVDYVPNITPAYNWLILSPTSNNPNVLRNDNGAMYIKLCNVAKMNANSTTRLILIDSWNKWDEDMQLEPAQSYGDSYLNITREQFKKN
jgi:hypothetical protein